ncbi:hypothetical protein GCM10009069_06200 [Algimonas arctica]|uniref:Uncharacterized protein n=1 Tax=Algimonas arctica TaxID=1479486 RepID=A0A8J3CMC1_9PROT|nr:hypothetical protein [Algimonas arctica]GHA85748.1 hypothetical protein GCM10009069_06200 [Algimonas arctica]
MGQLFRKEAMERRSRALFGEVILRGPLPAWVVVGLLFITIGLIGFVLFGINVGDQTVWSWLRD